MSLRPTASLTDITISPEQARPESDSQYPGYSYEANLRLPKFQFI